jgi:hypothetical protein
MLKAQIAARPLPLGCHWPSESAHPLAERIRLLARRPPRAGRRMLGAVAVGLGGAAVGFAVWAAQPPRIVTEWTPGPAPRSERLGATPGEVAADRQATGRPEPHSTPATDKPARMALAAASSAAPPGADDWPRPTQAPAPQAPPAVLLPVSTDDFDRMGNWPLRRFHAAADRSMVEPGKAVRVLATMTDPRGITLTTDLTAYGSQSYFRTGYILRNGSRYELFTGVVQRGDRLTVTAALNGGFDRASSGSVTLASGQTGSIRLPNGQLVQVTPTLRDETPKEQTYGSGRVPPAERFWRP